ncbi:fatty acid desaturase family protein [Aestuariimicrobium kwangyangense]|uniref:fatty acid desaturase family protein n=1 Tax=Aestuariimicrobium kwangyangense TaxID=396389 RepID=UPI0003B6B47E|nr:acyl-CoA desaturase [Aestuariimicrobium kwangyangense]
MSETLLRSSPATDTPSKYVDAASFPPQLRAFVEVSTLAKGLGLMKRARWFYALLLTILALGLGGCIAGFILLGHSWFQLLIAAALGIIFTQVAFVGHEADHRQILESGENNNRLARLLATGVVGLSLSWWQNKHSRHHGNPNRVGKDPDIERDTISFLEEDASRAKGWLRWVTKRQGWLFFPLLTLEGLNLHLHSVRHVLGRGKVDKRATEIVLLAVRFAAVLVPVFWLLPLGMAFAFVGVQVAVFGVYMGASFAPNHTGMPIIDKRARLDFFTKQVRTSRNIRGGWAASLLMGGLNYQIEHHLFPTMARPHLGKARAIVRDYCRKHNVPYTETTLLASYGIVVRYLNEVGLHARDPFDCPMNAQYRRV